MIIKKLNELMIDEVVLEFTTETKEEVEKVLEDMKNRTGFIKHITMREEYINYE